MVPTIWFIGPPKYQTVIKQLDWWKLLSHLANVCLYRHLHAYVYFVYRHILQKSSIRVIQRRVPSFASVSVFLSSLLFALIVLRAQDAGSAVPKMRKMTAAIRQSAPVEKKICKISVWKLYAYARAFDVLFWGITCISTFCCDKLFCTR